MESAHILSTIGAAATPVGELRFAIPLAILKFDFTWYQAMGWAILGNVIPVLILPHILYRLGRLMEQFPEPIRSILLWRTSKLRQGGSKWVAQHGSLALIPLVAIPLPFTGAWTGCLAAWALDIHPRRSIPSLILGVVLAAIIVTTLTTFGVSLNIFLREPN